MPKKKAYSYSNELNHQQRYIWTISHLQKYTVDDGKKLYISFAIILVLFLLINPVTKDIATAFDKR